jgi:hypothetical protein
MEFEIVKEKGIVATPNGKRTGTVKTKTNRKVDVIIHLQKSEALGALAAFIRADNGTNMDATVIMVRGDEVIVKGHRKKK